MDNVDLFREINNDLKEERLYKLMRKSVPFLVVISLFIIIVTSIIVWRNKVELNDQYKMSEIFYKALTTEKFNKTDIAVESYDYLINNHIGSYASLASLKKASFLINQKEYEKAFIIYEDFLKESSNNILLKYIAETKIATMIVNGSIKRKLNLEALLNKLQSPNNPWRGMALELKVLWLLNSHREAEAKNLLEVILKDQTLSEIYKQRAEAIKLVKFQS